MDEEDQELLKECYSVVSYGPFPISFYKIADKYYYHPLEHDNVGPYESLDEAVKEAEIDFALADGGFHEDLDDAGAHAEWMREQECGVVGSL